MRIDLPTMPGVYIFNVADKEEVKQGLLNLLILR